MCGPVPDCRMLGPQPSAARAPTVGSPLILPDCHLFNSDRTPFMAGGLERCRRPPNDQPSDTRQNSVGQQMSNPYLNPCYLYPGRPVGTRASCESELSPDSVSVTEVCRRDCDAEEPDQ